MVAAVRRCMVAAALLGSAQGLRTLSLTEPPEMDAQDVAEGFFDNDADDADSPAVGYDSATPFGFDDATAADWAIAEAIQELHPAKIPSLESRLAATQRVDVNLMSDRTRNVPANSTPPAAGQPEQPHPGKWVPEGLRLFYGSHHKAGTNLLRHLCVEQLRVVHGRYCINRGYFGELPPNCTATPKVPQVWFLGNYTGPVAARIARINKYWRAVNMVRDPVAMAVSGYIYHMHVIKDTPRGLEKVRNMSLVDALAVEADYVLQGNGQEMARSYQMNDTRILQMHLEDFTSSSESFDKSATTVLDHMAGDLVNETDKQAFLELARNHDLRRSLQDNATQGNGSHVADKDFKKLVQEAIKHIPDEVMSRLKELRRKVGYTD